MPASSVINGEVTIRRLGEPGDLGWVVLAHGEMYAKQFGWDVSFEALVARIVADYAGKRDDTREAAWLAEQEGLRVGCKFRVPADEQTPQPPLLLVGPAVRGHGTGAPLVDECLEFA